MNNKPFLDKKSSIKERLFEYVKTFSFPRLPGTDGEEEAVELTYKTFKKFGYDEDQLIKENFSFSDFYSTTLVKLIMTINLIFYLMLLLFAYIYPFVIFVVTPLMAVLVLLIIRGLENPEDPGFWGKYYGETRSATNVIAKLDAKELSTEKAGDIVISAHLDSKSQTFKTAWRVVLYRVWLFGGLFLGIFFTLFILQIFELFQIDIGILAVGIWTSTIVTSFSNLLLMFLSTHNRSPGALDNASGMAVVFELGSYFIENPLKNFNLWFCQFSAEELGTMGSRIFVKNHENEFKEGRVFQINLDMISSASHSQKRNKVEYLKSYGLVPRRKLAPLLSTYLDQAAEEEDLEIRGFHLTTGAHLDSVAFHQRGYAAIDITTRAAAKWTHSKYDTPDKVDPKILKNAYTIIKKSILKLDKNYETLCSNGALSCDIDG